MQRPSYMNNSLLAEKQPFLSATGKETSYIWLWKLFCKPERSETMTKRNMRLQNNLCFLQTGRFFRLIQDLNLSREPQKVTLPFFSPPKSNEPKTPVKSQPSTSRETRSARKRLSQLSSPAKRPRRNGQGDQIENSPTVETELVESESEQAPVVKFMTVTGQVEFRKPSLKKLQTECRWKRPCKLSVAYSSSTSRQDCCIYLIIYESNVKCRRNLLREFEEAEKEDWGFLVNGMGKRTIIERRLRMISMMTGSVCGGFVASSNDTGHHWLPLGKDIAKMLWKIEKIRKGSNLRPKEDFVACTSF